jgi:hypothetical protein
MRQTQLRTLVHRDARAPLTFTGAAGEHFQLTVLDHHLVRVQHCPEGAPRLDRTWLIAGADGDTPRAGRARADLSPFPRSAPQIVTAAGRVEVRTDALQIALDLADGALTWRDAAGRVFAADVPGRAYSYDRASRAVYHYQQRQPGERYFGFGEKSGALDKAGRRAAHDGSRRARLQRRNRRPALQALAILHNLSAGTADGLRSALRQPGHQRLRPGPGARQLLRLLPLLAGRRRRRGLLLDLWGRLSLRWWNG